MPSTSDGARLALGVALLTLAGCPRFSNDGLVCAAGGTCPPGFHCARDNRCWKLNQNPSSDMSGAVNGDLGVVSLDLSGLPPGSDLAGSTADLAPTLGVGQLCMSGSDCMSHNCVDGVCCDLPCASSCTSCNQATSLGHCAPVPSSGTPSHGTCGPDTMASCGRNGKCDGAGNCSKFDATTICGMSSCTNGMFTAAPRCDGNGKCATPNATPCDPYVCMTDNSACFTACAPGTTAQCLATTCDGTGSCGPRSNGQPCNADVDCKMGHCVDKTCCDTPLASCSGCKACNLGTPGTCANIPSGDPHNACPTNASNCVSGGCGGGSCVPSTSTTVCATSCMATNMFSVSKCSGSATGCPALGAPTACAGSLVCADASSCKQTCSADSDCLAGDWCNGGNCAPQGSPGTGCTLTALCTASSCDQCKSGAPCTFFAQDADGDGFGSTTAGSRFCGTTAPAGYSTDNSDCCDILNSATARATHVGQTGWFTSANDCGNFDYDCVGGEVPQSTAIGSCSNTGQCNASATAMCSLASGWVTTAPGCGGMGYWLTGCGSTCCSHTCEGGGACCGGKCTGSNTSVPQTQGCH